MSLDRWSVVPAVLGVILLAASGADGHELATLAGDDDWWLIGRFELGFLAGLWLLSGLAARWARLAAVMAFVGILAWDVARATAGFPPRYAFGRIAVGPWWVLVGDLVILAVLVRWRPTAPAPRMHPGWAAGAAVLGIVTNGSQVGYFPIIATAPLGGLPGSAGLDYVVYLPDGYYYRRERRWPLILYLHGAGAVGRDIGRARAGGIPLYLEKGGRLPFVVVAPQSPQYGWDIAALGALLDEVVRRYRVDEARVYLSGTSMGGYGTWAFAAAHPGRFAAIAPICGGGDPAWADRLRSVPIWAFHGAEDAVVPPEESRKMVAALERAGGDVRLTIYPGVGHDSATMTYADHKLYDWFLAHRRRPGEGKVE